MRCRWTCAPLTSAPSAPWLQLLAPTNASWEAAAASLGLTTQQLLSSRNALRDIVFTHIIPNTPLSAATLATMKTVAPQAGQPMYVSAAPGGPISLISVGSTAQVTKPDYATGENRRGTCKGPWVHTCQVAAVCDALLYV